MIHVRRFQQLSDEEICAWSDLQRTQPTLDSPFFCLEFARVVAEIRDDVEVAVLRNEGDFGFFCYQREHRKVAVPVGDIYADFQGLVARDVTKWSMDEVLRQCRLSACHFDHLLAAQSVIGDCRVSVSDSPYIDLSDGFDEFQRDRRRAGSQIISQTARKLRKMEREVAPVRFEYQTADRNVVDALVQWKRQQYHRAGAADFLADRWAVELLNGVAKCRSDDFSGVVSALYVGDQLAAAHLGMVSRDVFHYWHPAYDPSLGRYSPGLILLLKIIQAAAESGVRRIDLGKGDERYKLQLKSGATSVAVGSVDLRPITRRVRGCVQSLDRFVRRSPLETPARFLVRGARAMFRSANLSGR